MPDQPVSPLLLAVDTTAEYGSLALLRGHEVIEEVLLHAPGGFAQILYGQLSGLLERHALRAEALDAFAAASGPGSFTGVRVGLACVKGLAEALARPAFGVSILQALALSGQADLRAVALDARRGQIYGAVYDRDYRLVCEEVVAAPAAWLATLPVGDLEFISPDFTAFGELLDGARRVVATRSLAGAIGVLAAARLEHGETPDPASLDANYVRRSDAELFWKE